MPAIVDEGSSIPSAESQPEGTYGQILKSSAIVGGSTVLNVGIGIVRTKIMALLLGPAGFGLAGLYTSIITLTQNIAELGINSSGVRQIAEAVGSGDQNRISKTALVLRRTAVVLGLLGAALLVLFSKQVSMLTFGDTKQRGAVCLISLAVLFQLISAGQIALIQGMRRIADLAKINIIGAFSGLVISVPVVYFLRMKGIAISLVLVAATTIVSSWWYSRKVRITAVQLERDEIKLEVEGLLKLGVAFMASGLMVPGVAYFVRVFLLHHVGVAATGMYQSAWAIGGLYVGFILQAMGADFYPRLAANVHNHAEINRLVNEQTLVGLLLAGPGVTATLTFAPLVIIFLYSAKFSAAVGVLRWICLGVTMQVITWPMGYIIVAQARQLVFIGCELAWMVVSLGLAWLCVRTFGLNGAGIAFFLSYVFHLFLIYPIAWKSTGFRWSATSKRTCSFIVLIIAIVFGSYYALPVVAAVCVGIVGTGIGCWYSVRTLSKLISLQDLPQPIRKLLFGLRALRPQPTVVETR